MGRRQLLLLWIAGLALLGGGIQVALPADGGASVVTESKYIALTFDDGPGKDTTAALLDGLKVRGAAATFFLVGAQAEQYPDLVQRMQAEGHQVGNHTWNHVRLETADAATLQAEVGRTEALLQKLLGGSDYWLRPPYGQVAAGMEDEIPVPMVKWSVDPRDWESRNTEKILEAILSAARPNSIILLHDIYPASVEAALQAVDVLQAEGYWFVTVEELLQLGGVTPEAGKLYRTGKG